MRRGGSLRWQLFPGYLSGLCLIICQSKWARASPVSSFLLLLVGLIGLAAAIFLARALPVFSFPALRGKYQVGSRLVEIVDTSRPFWPQDNRIELGTETEVGTDEKRRLLLRLWYPAASGAKDECERSLYWPRISRVAQAFAVEFKIKPWLLNHLGLVRIESWENAPVRPPADAVDTGYPIVLFSHGWHGFHSQNLQLCQALASDGYFVVSVQHTGDATMTPLNDGRNIGGLSRFPNKVSAVLDKLEARPVRKHVPGEAARSVKKWLPSMLTYWSDSKLSTDESLQKAHDAHGVESVGDGFRQLRLYRRAGMLVRCDDLLAALRYVKGEFGNFVDATRVGVAGHSYGGATALQSLGLDDSIRCALGLDPWMFPLHDDTVGPPADVDSYIRDRSDADRFPGCDVSAKPILVIQAPKFNAEDECLNRSNRVYTERVFTEACFTVRNAKHFDNTDVGTLSPIVSRMLGLTGMGSKSQRLQELQIAAARLLFKRHLSTGSCGDETDKSEAYYERLHEEFSDILA